MIQALDIKFAMFKFPAGEHHIRVESVGDSPTVYWDYAGDDEIVALMLLFNAIEEMGKKPPVLSIGYLPFARQDRVAVKGESFSLRVMANVINSFGCRKVYLHDPHSDVAAALIRNVQVVEQYEIFHAFLEKKENFILVSPDGGALKKIYKLAPLTKALKVIECSKLRDVKTGKITDVHVPCGSGIENEFVIVDDICDGGRTFVEIAKDIKCENPNAKVTLMVTHGLFTKGLGVFDGLIDEIYTMKGQVK